MAADIVYPVLIGVGALLIGVVVHFLTRPKPSRADITVPNSPGEQQGASPATTTELGAWHRNHEAVLLSLFDHVDAIGGFGPVHDDDSHDGDGPTAGESAAVGNVADDNDGAGTPTQAVLDAVDAALSDHPAPDMRAELAALRGAADAMADARERDDGDAMERHLPVYLSYRAAWLERLWQFPVHGARIAEIRDRDVPGTDRD